MKFWYFEEICSLLFPSAFELRTCIKAFYLEFQNALATKIYPEFPSEMTECELGTICVPFVWPTNILSFYRKDGGNNTYLLRC